jgi:hypothetical protein
MTRHRYISIAATVAATGGAIWVMKFLVVAATGDGPVVGVLWTAGVLCLFLGSTWVGAMLAGERSRLLLAALVLLSPIAFFMSFIAFDDGLVQPLVGDGAPLWQEELGIATTGALWLAASMWALRRRRAPAGAPAYG